ncbi:hypothetical protein JCM3765_001625 [Sporobolomyces pararoseus]
MARGKSKFKKPKARVAVAPPAAAPMAPRFDCPSRPAPAAPPLPLRALPSQAPPFELKEIDGKGMGLVASRDLEPGTLVLKEVPIVVWSLEDNPVKLERRVSALTHEQRAQYNALAVCTTAEEEERSLAIFKTNSMQLGAGQDNCGVFLQGSRFNHSCTPNVQRHWDEEQGVEWFILSHQVKKGEELCITYQETRAARVTRRARLKEAFGFDCNCSTCSFSDLKVLISDTHRTQIKYLDESTSSLQSKPLELIKTVNQIIHLLKEEELVTCRTDAAFEAMSACVWNGDRLNASRWIDRILDYEKVEAGVWSTKYRDVEAWKGDPTRHPAWNINSSMMGIPSQVLVGPW